MKGFDRFFLFLLSIAILIVSLFFMLVGFNFFTYDSIYQMIDMLYQNQDVKFTILASSILAAVFSIYFIIRSLHFNEVPTFSNKHSDIGEIRISMETLENLAGKVIAKVKGVKEHRVKVRLDDKENVTVIIKIFVDGETPIPQLSEEVQANVKQVLEHIAGVSIDHVHIIVANIGNSNRRKARVE